MHCFNIYVCYALVFAATLYRQIDAITSALLYFSLFSLIVSIINGRRADIGDVYCEFIYFSSHSLESAREIAAAIRFGREVIIIRFWDNFNMRFYLFDF